MRFPVQPFWVAAALALVPPSFSSTTPIPPFPLETSTLRNANHIFNAIHSSLRQWGSSLNHNGMSFFLATVPQGTQLYHGTYQSAPVTGTEWLAFEPEHSLIFARPRRRRPRPPPGEGRPDDGGRRPPLRRERGGAAQHPMQPERKDWKEREEREKEEDGGQAGYLHTYAAKTDLRLLYVDGMSAGKTDNGTLDSQDYILLASPPPHRGMWERERAAGLCSLAAEEWEGRIDGILRMEGGFEIILCEFERRLDVVRITRAQGDDNDDEGDGRQLPFMGMRELDTMQYYKAIAARYDGIGGGRVVLDYEHFVTAYTYPVDLFHHHSAENGEGDEDAPLPRLTSLSPTDLATIRSDVRSLIFTHSALAAPQSFNWQRIADMLVTRYSTALRYLLSPALTSSPPLFSAELTRLLRPFIDYSARNASAETSRCASQFTTASPPANSSLAARVVTDVAHTLCHTLVAASAAARAKTAAGHAHALVLLDQLVNYLNWTSWKRCRGCGDDELCVVPIWPMGAGEDHRRPRCMNATEVVGRRGYWGERGWGAAEVEGERDAEEEKRRRGGAGGWSERFRA